MKRNSVLTIVAILILAFTMTVSGTTTQTVKPADIEIGVTLITLADPFFASIKEGLEAEAVAQGIGKLVIQDGQGDAARQMAQVEDFVAQGFDIIVINPVEAETLANAAKVANDAGILVLTMDRFLATTYGPDGVVLSHVGADAVDGGRIGIRIIAKALEEKYGEAKGNILYIEGTPGSSAAADRTKGVQQELENYPNIKIVAQQPGETREKALGLVENWLQQYSDIDGIYAYGGDSALGALQAVISVSKPEILVVGTGAAWDEIESIKEGKLFGTVDFNPVGTGRDAITTAIKVLNGESVDEWVRTEAQPVTAENFK